MVETMQMMHMKRKSKHYPKGICSIKNVLNLTLTDTHSVKTSHPKCSGKKKSSMDTDASTVIEELEYF